MKYLEVCDRSVSLKVWEDAARTFLEYEGVEVRS